jgi:hypothetical protein
MKNTQSRLNTVENRIFAVNKACLDLLALLRIHVKQPTALFVEHPPIRPLLSDIITDR